MNLVEITAQLEEPFPLAEIDLLPKGEVTRDGKTLCMALPYADKRVYEDRFNALAPGEWSTPPPLALVAGQKLICYVTVILCGVTHTDVGEAPLSSENTGTEAYAQAFKRAASQFGLGRYLYSLEKIWVPYDKQRKQIALDDAGKRAIVRQMYNRAQITMIDSLEKRERANSERAQAGQQNKTPIRSTPAVAPSYARTDIPQPRQLREQCERLYPGQWEEVITRLLGKRIADDDLTQQQCATLSAKLTRVEKNRKATPIVAAEQEAS